MKSFAARVFPFVAAALLAACASAPVVPLPQPAADEKGEVVVYREYAFAAGGVALSVGSGGAAFASLSNAEKVRAAFPVGKQEIYVQARSAEPTRVRIAVQKGGVTCLRTSASPSTYAKLILPPVLMVTGYHFYLDEVPCPSTQELSEYKDVQVSYR